MNEKNLQIHPEAQRSAEENDLLREELANLLTEAEDLVKIIKPHLLALYQTKIGGWELRSLQAQLEMARLKRKIELVQAALNRGERPDLNVIEGQLELDFLAWQSRLKEAVERIQAAEARMKKLLSPGDDRELKMLYYALVKKLHPDLNPKLTDDQKRLWLRVQSAYEAGDLAEMRALSLLAEKFASVPPPAKSLDKLRQDRQTLESQIVELLKRIEQIESQPPLTLRKDLADETWVAARRTEIEQQIAKLQAQGNALAAHLQGLLTSNDHGHTFGKN